MENRESFRLQGALAGLCWAVLFYLLFGLYFTFGIDLTTESLFTPLRLLTYILLIVSPALTFFPVARLLRLGGFALFGTISWGALGYLAVFVNPSPGGRVNHVAYAVFLVLFFAALISLFLPISYAAGFRFFSLRIHRHDLTRAWRESSMMAVFGVACLILQAIDMLSPVNAVLLLMIIALTELFFLARKK